MGGNRKMKIRILCLFICTLLILHTLTALGSMNFNQQQKFNNISKSPIDGGWIEEYDEFTILHVNGSYYNMGYQHGFLLSEEIGENYRAFLNFSERFDLDHDFYVWYWNALKDNVSQAYLNELQGMADGSGMSLLNISIFNIMADYFHCCEAAAWGPATSDGKTIHIRSFDWGMIMIDPISGKNVRENQILMVRNPEQGYASLELSFSGLIGGPGGINENGIACGILVSYSWDENNLNIAEGSPVTFRMKTILDQASTAEEAVDIINSNMTSGFNFIISDIDIGYAVEHTLHNTYSGTWDDPVEDTPPFFSIDHVVRRTNIFIDPELAATQRKFYNPSIFPLLTMILKLNPLAYVSGLPASIPWMHYKALSKELEKNWGSLEVNNSINMLRDIYLGKTDLRFYIVKRVTGGYVALHQWVACPETGDIAMCFATIENDAYENPIHYFNLFDLLEATPP